MSTNSEQTAAELVGLGYRPSPFSAPQDQGGADGVRFECAIGDGSRDGDTVTLAMAGHENEGRWPEVAPHWVYLSPPDDVLAELVKGFLPAGAVANYEFENGEAWMATSAPPSDFRDCIDTPVTCEFTHARLGLGEGWRPTYLFAEEVREGWRGRLMHRYRQVRMKVGRALSVIHTLRSGLRVEGRSGCHCQVNLCSPNPTTVLTLRP